jgi:hypothetical protein
VREVCLHGRVFAISHKPIPDALYYVTTKDNRIQVQSVVYDVVMKHISLRIWHSKNALERIAFLDDRNGPDATRRIGAGSNPMRLVLDTLPPGWRYTKLHMTLGFCRPYYQQVPRVRRKCRAE